jgi:hypothetical protein
VSQFIDVVSAEEVGNKDHKYSKIILSKNVYYCLH